jgi:hypothetical protein
MHSDTVKRFLERLLHGSYMVDILHLLGIAPITEQQDRPAVKLAFFLKQFILRYGTLNFIINAIYACLHGGFQRTKIFPRIT